jgi:hypothetical protein
VLTKWRPCSRDFIYLRAPASLATPTSRQKSAASSASTAIGWGFVACHGNRETCRSPVCVHTKHLLWLLHKYFYCYSHFLLFCQALLPILLYSAPSLLITRPTSFDSAFGQNPVSTQAPQFPSMKDSYFEILQIQNLHLLIHTNRSMNLIPKSSRWCFFHSWYLL